MPLQDLTPQLRTRLSRMERAVGWFVTLALLLFLFGFAYYVYHTAENKGWFLTKAPYYVYVNSASGLRVGDPVMLMGSPAGAITQITPMAADDFAHNIYVQFDLAAPHYDYIWTDGSRAKLAASGLLDKRVLEVTRGTGGYLSYISNPLDKLTIQDASNRSDLQDWALAQEVYDTSGIELLGQPKWPLTNLAAIAAIGYTQLCIMNLKQTRKSLTGIWNDKKYRYDSFTSSSKYGLRMEESPAVTEQIQQLVARVQQALPNVFRLTNQLANVLSNSANLTSNLNVVVLDTRPAISNLTLLTAQINRPGALGEWLLPTNLNRQLEHTLAQSDAAILSANTNLAALAENLGRSLDNLAGITSNLNAQVQANTNMLSAISQTIIHSDQLIQGLKHHWLLRSAFRTPKTNAPPKAPRTSRQKPLAFPREKE